MQVRIAVVLQSMLCCVDDHAPAVMHALDYEAE